MPTRTQKSSFVGTTYAEADKFLGTKNSAKIANNTYMERVGPDHIGIRLHSTYVVTYCGYSGMVRLSSGGWQTPTTARRIEQFARIGVHFTGKGSFVYYRNPKYDASAHTVLESFWDFKNKIEFFDGVEVNESGYAS